MRFIFITRSLIFLFFFSAVSCKNSKTESLFESNSSSDNLSPTVIEACSLINESSESVINVDQPLGGYTTRTKNNIKFEFKELVSPYEVTAASFSKAGNRDLLVSYLSKQDKVIIQIYVTTIPADMRGEVEDFFDSDTKFNSFVNAISNTGEVIEKRIVRVNDRKFIEIDWLNKDFLGNSQRTIQWITFFKGSMINVSGTAHPDNFMKNLEAMMHFNCSLQMQ